MFLIVLLIKVLIKFILLFLVDVQMIYLIGGITLNYVLTYLYFGISHLFLSLLDDPSFRCVVPIIGIKAYQFVLQF